MGKDWEDRTGKHGGRRSAHEAAAWVAMRRDVPNGMKSVLYAAATHFPWCTASLDVLALEAGVSKRTAGKYLRALEHLGFIKVSPSYRNGVRGRLIDFMFDKTDLVRQELEVADEVVADEVIAEAEKVNGAIDEVHQVTEVADGVLGQYPDCQQTININNQEQSTEQPFAGAEPRSEEGSSLSAHGMTNEAAKRSELYSALLDVCGLNEREMTRSSLGALSKAVKELLDLAGGVTVVEVDKRAAEYHRMFPKVVLTPSALAKHWPNLNGQSKRGWQPGGRIGDNYDEPL